MCGCGTIRSDPRPNAESIRDNSFAVNTCGNTSADGTYRGTTSGTYRGTTSGPRFASTR